MLSNKADNPTHCSSISKYYTKLPKCKSAQVDVLLLLIIEQIILPIVLVSTTQNLKCKSAQPANAHHKSGDKENNNVTQTALPSLY